MEVTTIGFDIAKGVFQVHGDDAGEVTLRRRLSRAQVLALFEHLPPCLVGMEACGSAHHWARAISALGHDVRLISPAYVKPYVKRGHRHSRWVREPAAHLVCRLRARRCLRETARRGLKSFYSKHRGTASRSAGLGAIEGCGSRQERGVADMASPGLLCRPNPLFKRKAE